MKTLNEKLNIIKKAKNDKIHIMIIGPGSVGLYLLDYLMSMRDPGIDITVVGRNREKMLSDINIVRVASAIRGQGRSKITIKSNVDLNNITSIKECLISMQPDIIVNSSRVYSGLKYGRISWSNLRAYGIWAPLAVKFIRNIMQAYEEVGSNAIVINTSYSDVVIPWLKSARKAYPDFGSGNINHLIPRIKFAVAEEIGIIDYWNIDVTYAVSHFHDVVISKEGQTEGTEQLIDIRYQGEKLKLPLNRIFSKCKIAMPVDGKRNMMNASSNFEIICAILSAVRGASYTKLHCPGIFGEIGGYPIVLDSRGPEIRVSIDESSFSLDEMRKKNKESIYLDGIEDVTEGILTFTDELLAKAQKAFDVSLVKQVSLENNDETAEFLIENIIKPFAFCE